MSSVRKETKTSAFKEFFDGGRQKKNLSDRQTINKNIPLRHLVWFCPTRTRSLQMTAVAVEEKQGLNR